MSYIRAAFLAVALLGSVPPAEAQTLQLTRNGTLRTSGGSNLVSHNVLSDPSVLYDGGRYRMWFTTARYPYTAAQTMGIGYAESLDGRTWSTRMSGNQPALVLGPSPGMWDAAAVETASVVKRPDGRYFMYYTGYAVPGSHTWAIGLASSSDGINWRKEATSPVLSGRGGWEGPSLIDNAILGGVTEPSVIYDSVSKLYKMWYSAFGVRNGRMGFRAGYAVSTNGRNWTAHANPVVDIGADGSSDDAVVSQVNVVYHPSTGYHMFYFGTSAPVHAAAEASGAVMIPGAIGYARSADGINWSRALNPVLSPVANTWEAWTVGGPSAVLQGNNLKVFYFASAVSNAYSFRMGLATATLPAQ